MTVHLVTGHAGKIHVTAAEQGAFNAYAFGTGNYVIGGCQATKADNNTVHVADGTMLLQGRHVNINAGGEDVAIRTGTVNQTRTDVVCLVYRMDISSGVETVGFEVIEGQSGSSAVTPTVPQTSILNGDNPAYIPFCRVTIDKTLVMSNPVMMLDSFVRYMEAAPSVKAIVDGAVEEISGTANVGLAEIAAAVETGKETFDPTAYSTKSYVDGAVSTAKSEAIAAGNSAAATAKSEAIAAANTAASTAKSEAITGAKVTVTNTTAGGSAQLQAITASTTDLTAGSSNLATGALYFVYE